MAYINKHNAEAAGGKHSFTLGVNKHADLTTEEFAQMLEGFDNSRDNDTLVKVNTFEHVRNVPIEADWVEEVIKLQKVK